MEASLVEGFKNAIAASNNPLIVCHKSPDGDAIGSSMALYHYLVKKGKRASVLVPDSYPDFLSWMPGNDQVNVYDHNKEAGAALVNQSDLIFTLDFNSLGRVGEMGELIGQSEAPKVMIDHHRSPGDYADVTISLPEICSTAQIVYLLIEAAGDAELIDQNIAPCIYCGIVTDTGSFRFSSVDTDTHRIAAALIAGGLDHEMVHRQVYDSNVLDRMKLVGYALSEKLVMIPEIHTAYISLSKEELERFNYRPGDTEGLVNQALSIVGVNMAAFIREGNNQVKLSLRSKGSFDVNLFAREHFNGGGHMNAAGGASQDDLGVVVERFIKAAHANASTLNYQ